MQGLQPIFEIQITPKFANKTESAAQHDQETDESFAGKRSMLRGPLLAYLMTDPELSLQSILIIAAIIGKPKAWTYVGWVALFSTLAGLIYGAYVDGASAGLLIFYVVAVLAVLALALWLASRRKVQKPQAIGKVV